MSIPDKPRKLPIVDMVVAYALEQNFFIVAENEDGKGYRLSIWSFDKESLTLLFISDVDSENKCEFL